MVDKFRIIRMRNLIKAQRFSKYNINNIEYQEEKNKTIKFTVTKYTQKHRHSGKYRHFYSIDYISHDLAYSGSFKRPEDYWNYYYINSTSFVSYIAYATIQKGIL